MRKAVASILPLLWLLSACHVTRYTAAALPDEQLVIGSGNAAGIADPSLILLKNGQVFASDPQDSVLTERQPLSARSAAAFFEQAERLQLHRQDINRPGNLYFFLQLNNPLAIHRVTWGAGDYLPPTDLIRLYRALADRLLPLPPLRKHPPTETAPQQAGIPAPDPAPRKTGGW